MASEASGAPAADSAAPNTTVCDVPPQAGHDLKGHGFLALALGAVGVVFGDIGTSPLYAMREALAHSRSTTATEHAVLGVVSLVLWTLTLFVTIKYV
ncbi:MAG: KUP/HAK/KT family potassium transporter, partial [Caulobacter sp.]|nr:KUP/HAK/KT family potassium transporter [Caulobacter sp.]